MNEEQLHGETLGPSSVIGSETDLMIGSETDLVIGSDTDLMIGSDTDLVISSFEKNLSVLLIGK